MTIIEKILASHSKHKIVKPGDIIDVTIDARVARDFGGANVVKHLRDNALEIDDPGRTFFTFDCNPTGSDQKYAASQQVCRLFAREKGIPVYDIDAGIGTHLLIEKGIAIPGSTAVSTDSHANILGAVGAFGQGMGDLDIAVAWNQGKLWFKVPPSVKIHCKGFLKPEVTAKDFALNLLHKFGANELLGYSVEFSGDIIDQLSLDQRITISSMGTEMGAIILFFSPTPEILNHFHTLKGKQVDGIEADYDAHYAREITVDLSTFDIRLSKPGKPDDTVSIDEIKYRKIDSAFIGSCTNGRMEDLRVAAAILKGRKIAPRVVLKIVPATAAIWEQCLKEGILAIFRESGALISNPGCAGCAAGQVGQNGPGEVTVSTGNRNFPGKQGKGDVFLASPDVVAASALAGYITSPDDIPSSPALFAPQKKDEILPPKKQEKHDPAKKPTRIEGRVWYIPKDDIDTDMIFHNRYLTITDIEEMGKYTFDNLKGYEDFAKKAQSGDIIVVGKNFGAGSSRQQAVDCFISLGIQCVIAESFGAIYERNAINAAFPIITSQEMSALQISDGDTLTVDFSSGEIQNISKKKQLIANKFSEVQMDIYLKGGIL